MKFKKIIFVIVLVLTPALGFMTDYRFSRITWHYAPPIINTVIPGIIFWLFFVFILTILRKPKNRIYTKFTFWGIIFGFVLQQLLLVPFILPVYFTPFSHPTVDGPVQGNIFGIFVDYLNYFLAIVFGIVGGIIDGIRYWRKQRQKHPSV